MSVSGRRIVLGAAFDEVLAATCRAIREEGLQLIARVDVRDHFWRDLRHSFRHYVLVDAWSPEGALDVLLEHPEVGLNFATRFAIYDAGEGKTTVLFNEALGPMAAQPECLRDTPALAAIATGERDKSMRVLERLQRTVDKTTSKSSAV